MRFPVSLVSVGNSTTAFLSVLAQESCQSLASDVNRRSGYYHDRWVETVLVR